ncbi:MAG: SHOCT domain-containing protein [Woeseiaceae bacterium]|nr:SHOCT domain-containing protein [Woeseiaceae bacterium]
MIKRLLIASLIPGLLASPVAWSQAQDMAAERARIANQRIQVEAARIAEEEKRRAQAEAEEAAARERYEERLVQRAEANARTPVEEQPVIEPIPLGPASSPAPVPAPVSASNQPGLSRILEQIKTLGELRDAGYVTDEEFQRIKSKILDGEL